MDTQEAVKDIKLIRQMMERASHKFLFSPWQWIEWGILVMIGCLITDWLIRHGQLNHIIFLWIAIFIIGSALETFIWMAAARDQGIDAFNSFIVKLWGVAGCIMLMSIVLTFVFIDLNQILYIPGLWLMTMGTIFLSFFLLADRKDLLVIGAFQMVGGILAVSILLSFALYMLFIFFGIGSLTMGIYMLIKSK